MIYGLPNTGNSDASIGHATIEGLLKCDFSYSCAAVDKISTDMVSLGHSVIADLLVK